MKQSPTKPVSNSLEVQVEFRNKVLPFVSPFVLSQVSLAHRAPHTEALHPPYPSDETPWCEMAVLTPQL